MNIAKTYDPNQYEPQIYAMWETARAFAPTGQGTPYSLIMPPPNANGNLHVGHALDMNLKDVLARYHRMKGRDVAFIPGADHAGFETWVVYEKELQKQNKSRFDFSREQLYSQVWNFVDEKRGTMELQLRALGTSASWEDMVFTLDEKVINRVYDTFEKLWKDGLVYRGERIVNYCTTHHTSFSDIEVEHRNEKSKLWKIAYPTLDKIGEIIVATTRPETILGDTAIAVNPNDDRYKHLIGTRVLLPIVDKEIPIVGDEYVDPAFGTGAVKITPAHDPNDFEVGKRHNLPSLQVIDFDGKMINVPPQFMGLDVETARKRVLASLRAAEVDRGDENYEHSVGHCYKCNSVIQPLVKSQWFLKIKPLAEKAIAALEENKISFTPAGRKRVLTDYMNQLHDWNLSRQIPWGIPIPAFQNIDDNDDWIFNTNVIEPTIEVDGKTYKREEDTFDTWFSSGQWPFIITDYPDGKLSPFYPMTVLETGGDLLDRWVARMIMLGLYVTGDVPFKEVYLHGMVLDEKSQKMSKSKGNVINPMEVVAEYGSDALRLGIISARSAGQNQAFSTSKVVAGRNFCNKLWNIARFISGKVSANHHASETPNPQTLADHWLVGTFNAAIENIDENLAQYRFAEASDTMYHTIWDNFADWYLESSKVGVSDEMLAWALDTALKLAHPFAPFVTETIWQTLTWHDNLLAQNPWPEIGDYDEIASAEFMRLQTLVTEARFVTAELPGNKRYTLLHHNDSLVADNAELIKHLGKLQGVEATEQPRGLRLASSGRDAWLDVDEMTLYEHQSALELRLVEARQVVENLENRLRNSSYTNKAPAELVEETRQLLAGKQRHIERLVAQLDILT